MVQKQHEHKFRYRSSIISVKKEKKIIVLINKITQKIPEMNLSPQTFKFSG